MARSGLPPDTSIVTDARAIQKGLVLILPALLFGFLVAAQWSTLAGTAARDVAIRYIDPLSETVDGLQTQQASLKTQVAGLRADLDELRRQGATQSGVVRDIGARLEELKASAGLTEASGDGVLVTLGQARPQAGAAPEQERPTCLAPDLTDIVNASWRAGARAVAIGPERIVGTSSVYCIGGTIVVNGSIVSPPFEVAVVGTPDRIMAVLDDPAQLRDLKRRRDQQDVELTFSPVALLDVPAYTGPITVRAARSQ